MTLDAVQLSFLSSENERSLTREERIAAGRGAKRLLAKVLHQALVDEALAQDGGITDGCWPGTREPTNREVRAELDAFWSSNWLEWMCLWLDMEADEVVDYARGVRDGTQDLPTDKRRKV